MNDRIFTIQDEARIVVFKSTDLYVYYPVSFCRFYNKHARGAITKLLLLKTLPFFGFYHLCYIFWTFVTLIRKTESDI